MSEVVSDFQAIHDEFRPKIQRYLRQIVGDYEAEDLTQEVFIKISRALPAFRGESQLSTWIYRIATNAALDRLRAPSFTPIVEDGQPACSDLDDREIEDEAARIEEEASSVEQQICRKERFQCYRNHIEDLPANYRTVVALSELEELAAGEIADILGLSVETVKIRLHRGRVRLLQELKAHCKAEDWL